AAWLFSNQGSIVSELVASDIQQSPRIRIMPDATPIELPTPPDLIEHEGSDHTALGIRHYGYLGPDRNSGQHHQGRRGPSNGKPGEAQSLLTKPHGGLHDRCTRRIAQLPRSAFRARNGDDEAYQNRASLGPRFLPGERSPTSNTPPGTGCRCTGYRLRGRRSR